MIATRMLIIDKGKKVVEGKKNELLNPVESELELVTDEVSKALSVIKNSQWGPGIKRSEGQSILISINRQDVPELNRYLVQNAVNVLSLRPRHSLEDYFLSLTAH